MVTQYLVSELPRRCLPAAHALMASAILLGCASPNVQAVPPPTPSTLAAAPSGLPATSRAQSIAALGYVEQEYTLKGQARTYAKHGDWGDDGRWGIAPNPTPVAYATRLLVRRPTDPARFNGMVVVEWLNTVLSFDLDGIWSLTRDELVREGYAWVGVTAEATGMKNLKELDGARYAGGQVPTDDASYDIFSQAGATVRQRRQTLLGQSGPVKLLAGAYSQSAVFMNTYINAVQPTDQVYDGFLLHGRAPFAAPVVAGRWGAYDPVIRRDLAVPVMQVQSEMEVAMSWALSRTVDTDKVRYWEVAGATHFGRHLQDDTHVVASPDFGPQDTQCLKPINTLPLHMVDNAALHALRAWVLDGQPPPKAARMQRTALGFVKHDDRGNALGGLRLPALAVPVAVHGMYANFTTQAWSRRNIYSCIAGGSTKPLDHEELRKLYPTHEAYVQQFKAAADASLASGFLRPADHAELVKQAQQAQVP
jgi:hypothetical protein